MKRQISISIFLALLLIILAWLYIKINNEINPKEDNLTTENHMLDEPATAISKESNVYEYYVKEEYNKLVVYRYKNHEKFMETSINREDLPLDLQDKLKKYIFFQTEGELYDFLESYSS